MILVIRISGMVDVPESINYTLDNINLRRKYSAILLEENPENISLLNKIRSFVAYGKITDENLIKLISLRGERSDSKKIDAEAVIKNLAKKSLKEQGMKPFFRLHPPRGGIESKKHFGVSKKAVLGDNKEHINKLLERML